MKFPSTLARFVSPVALLAGSPLVAQEVAEAPATPAPVEVIENEATGPALWKVADEDTTIYLFGTVHFLPPELEWLDEGIESALLEADLIVKELDPGKTDPASIQAVLARLAFLPQGETMKDILTEEQYALFDAERQELAPQIAAAGLPPALLDNVEPWFASLQLVVAKFAKLGFAADSGVEAVLRSKAPETPRAGLETLEFQFGLFAGLPRERQVEYMIETINASDEIQPMLDEMVKLWMAGDPDGLAAFLNEAMTEADVAEDLLYKRNANWAEWIEDRLETPGTVFMAVGTGHLAGKKSVQDLLQQRDLTVERVQ